MSEDMKVVVIRCGRRELTLTELEELEIYLCENCGDIGSEWFWELHDGKWMVEMYPDRPPLRSH